MKISLTLIDFFLLALSIQGFILSALLFSTSKKIYSNRWIAAFIFVISDALLMQEIDYSNVWVQHLWIVNFIVYFNMALGPLVYLYARSLIYSEKKLKRNTFLHFVPLIIDLKRPIIFLFYISGLLSVPFIQRFYFLPGTQRFLFAAGPFSGLPAIISVTAYSIITYNMVSRHLREKNLSSFKIADLKWIKKLLQLVLGLILLWVVAVTFRLSGFVGPRSTWQEYIFIIPEAIFVYWLGMAAYLRQRKMDGPDLLEYNQKPAKPYFDNTEAAEYERQLIRLMETDKLYLNPLLKLETLAEKLVVPEKAISSLLNQFVGKNFNDFVNEYRVEEAKVKLTDPDYNYLSIAGIAFECGFNSLTTFQRAFKQFSGLTPSQYQTESRSSEFALNNGRIQI